MRRRRETQRMNCEVSSDAYPRSTKQADGSLRLDHALGHVRGDLTLAVLGCLGIDDPFRGVGFESTLGHVGSNLAPGEVTVSSGGDRARRDGLEPSHASTRSAPPECAKFIGVSAGADEHESARSGAVAAVRAVQFADGMRGLSSRPGEMHTSSPATRWSETNGPDFVLRRPGLGWYDEIMNPAPTCEHEIRELHDFFTRWYVGMELNTDAAFARFADVMADEFVMITPDGRRLDRQQVLEFVRAGAGSRSLTIETRGHDYRGGAGGLHVMMYEEWQRIDDEETGRHSTAVFRERADTPNGIEWLLVHETWIDG
jgi:hypothetical protein